MVDTRSARERKAQEEERRALRARAALHKATVDDFDWQGQVIPINAERLRGAYNQAIDDGFAPADALPRAIKISGVDPAKKALDGTKITEAFSTWLISFGNGQLDATPGVEFIAQFADPLAAAAAGRCAREWDRGDDAAAREEFTRAMRIQFS